MMELQEREAVPVFTEVDREKFLRDVYPQRRPAVLRGVCLGPCLHKWTVDYLRRKGGSKQVKIHVSTVPQMDFLRKNFVYKTLPFNEFVKRASENKHTDFFLSENESYYLRSLGEDVRKEPADLSRQFPELSEDFHIPSFFEPEQFFSSVFRISSCALQLWTHYDVMDNLLAQVTGVKRVVLFSPQNALHLYLSVSLGLRFATCFTSSAGSALVRDFVHFQRGGNWEGLSEWGTDSNSAMPLCHGSKVKECSFKKKKGDKSEVLDIDAPDLKLYPEFVKAKRYECVLEPGDLLFIPESYDKKDMYGNKEPVAAARALQAVDRALLTLDQLPANYRDFYGRCMIQRIQKRTYCEGHTDTAPQNSGTTLPSSPSS
ncbi:tRNA wybutosine-synthesizing protein 5 isoform X2 [Gouania willdenowi]|uniref:tRNA wybutosine-synthesizing protein 5 isoform X2 n=1 Tax=Gouania willdenowi TaxID=441366 RepID=UPI0010561B69|nr:tRNA wybutosine-synthesizing protein 5 isoform X2 [Gouania willdenowi]